jgi:hypothetical protein
VIGVIAGPHRLAARPTGGRNYWRRERFNRPRYAKELGITINSQARVFIVVPDSLSTALDAHDAIR